MTTAYLITLASFDPKYQQHVDPLYHAGLILLKADKDDQGHLANMEATHSYGFYSHPTPTKGETSFLDRKMGFRVRNHYAELREEGLRTLDSGFGIISGPLIELSEAEYAKLLVDLNNQKESFKKFFAQADVDALAKFKQAHPDFDIATADKNLLKKFYDSQYLFREKAYQDACNKISSADMDIIDQTAVQNALISNSRAANDVVAENNQIFPFFYSFSPIGSTCKPLMINFLIRSLKENLQDKHDKRIAALSEMKSEFYTGVFPRFDANRGEMIFDTKQEHYASSQKPFFAPKREWKDVEDHHATCLVRQLTNKVYLNSKGDETNLAQYQLSNENWIELAKINQDLLLIKRLLNSFINTTYDDKKIFAEAIQKVDGILEAIYKNYLTNGDINQAKANYDEAISYLTDHQVLSALSTISSTKNLRMEKVVNVEIGRLSSMGNNNSYHEAPLSWQIHR